jgi:chromosome segregation ATPase
MFAFFSTYKWLLELLAAGVIFVSTVYTCQKFLEREQLIGYNKAVAEYTAKALAAEQAARAKEEELTKQITEARNEAIKRDAQLEKLSTSLSSANSRLRDLTSTIRRNLSHDSPDTVINTSDAALAALAECSNRYSELAKTADEYASEIKLLQDSWPK